jgi:hypothetical protein
MKKYSLITTYYCKNCNFSTDNRFNFDGNSEDFYINFSNEISPFDMDKIPYVGVTKRRDLVYGKIFLLKDFIEKNILDKYEYLCHIDYSDTKFSGSFMEMMKKFESSNMDFIISTEKKCWPYLHAVNNWLDSPSPDEEFKFINSGAIISKTEKFLLYLNKLIDICLNENIDFWDDQGVWQYYNLKIEKLNADTNCEYFFSTSELDETYYTIENNKIKTKFETYPYLIHDNGSFNLNLISKI